MTPEVSIIIVNYNTGNLLYNCLKSIKANAGTGFEVIVADNNSGDGSISCCADFWNDGRFRLLRLDRNYGFSRANNMGAALASGTILHFLNPDTELQQDIDQDYAEALKHPDAVYVNPLVNRDGSMENDRMPLPVLRDIMLWNMGSPKARYWYKGASVIISSRNFRRLGGWCEDYFLFAEDLDLFYRIMEQGIPVREAGSVIFHLGGGSTSSLWKSLDREIMVQKSNRIFFRKYFSGREYLKSKLYYLFHNLVKHPSAVPSYIRAWYLSGKA